MSKVILGLTCVTLCSPLRAGADILDSENWDNHVEQIQQMNDAQQFRRTMNRGFDAMSSMGLGGGSVNPQSAAENVAKERATWNAALVLAPYASRRELNQFLNQGKFSPEVQRQIDTYMLRQFAAFPAAASRASLNPQNIGDARLLALQTAFQVARHGDTTPMPATLLLSIALQRSMTDAYSRLQLTEEQKQDARDYYVIVRALLLPGLPGAPESADSDAKTKESMAVLARAFVMKNVAVDPVTVSWSQMPCIGVSAVECQVHTAMARAALQGGR